VVALGGYDLPGSPLSGKEALATSETISGDLIAHVRFLYIMAKDRISINQTGDLVPIAVPSYILAVAAVEAFVNEMFLSDFGSRVLGKDLLPGDFEKLELRMKLIELPARVFGRTLSKGEQPYQDMDLLVELRNELVHYKMQTKPPKIIKQLAQNKIAVRVPAEEEQLGGPNPWTRRVGTLEGIRWANNTACKIVVALLNLAPPEKQDLVGLAHNFQLIP
jgi:hypothetical protein